MSSGRGVGARLPRSDARAKVTGTFDYSSDLAVDGMLHGATLRSPVAAARLRAVDTSAALALPGVHAVLTADDVPGQKLVGAGIDDMPVLAFGEIRHHGEPIAIVAADDAATARAARDLIACDLEPLDPLTTIEAALADDARPLHARATNALRTVRIRHGDPDATGPVVVRGTYEVGMQDQAFLGPESGVAVPREDGGLDLYVATQWLHVDREQVAAGLGLDVDRLHFVLAGTGGAFGGREDLSMQLHASLLALRTGRPVKMAYTRDESFMGGHVHRHPGRLEYEHHATQDGVLVAVRARIELDGGAYASSSTAVIANAATVAAGPYKVPNARVDAVVVYTNNPPCGAMRGFGCVQVAIGYEAQMDRLAEAVGLSPLEVRRRNALSTGDAFPTGQLARGPVPVARIADELEALPSPAPLREDPRAWPGSSFRSSERSHLTRGVGYAIGYKNVAFSEAFDDSATARVTLHDGGFATVHTAACEVGQGVVGVCEQIVREELGVDDVRVEVPDTRIASAGSASASRLTWMVGGALVACCAEIRAGVEAGRPLPIGAVKTYRHADTEPMDEDGQGEVHAGFAYVGHRAVVDVDVELGIARVAELTCVEDVGRAINPLALEGQLEGASIQGQGLALTEDLLVGADGVVESGSFGEYRIPTIVDAAPVPAVVLELGDPETPYGLKGVGELPSITSTPAVLAALRAATGRPVTRAPARPDDLFSSP